MAGTVPNPANADCCKFLLSANVKVNPTPQEIEVSKNQFLSVMTYCSRYVLPPFLLVHLFETYLKGTNTTY
jgi:hypothetical protein